MADHIGKLVKDITVILFIVELCLVLHIERLSHIHTVQPNLIRIYFFVPEISFRRTGLGFHLTVYQIYGFSVFFFPVQLIQCKQSLPCVDIVNIVLLHGIACNRTVFPDTMVNESIGKLVIFFLSCSLISLKQRKNHTSVNIIPAARLSGQCFFNIPHRHIQCTLFNQFINVSFKNSQLHKKSSVTEM